MSKIITVKNIFVVLLFLTSLLYLIFAFRTNQYFSLDDFFVLSYLKNHTTGEMIRQFLFQGDLWGFHKIMGYLNFRILFDLFGVNPWPYIVNNHIFQTVNVIMLFFLIDTLIGRSLKAFVFSIIFNSLYLYYFSNIHEYMVTFFCLSSILAYVKMKNYRLSLFLFFLGLLTKEVALSVPLILFSLAITEKKSLKPLVPFVYLSAGYVIFQLSFILTKLNLNPADTYSVDISIPNIINNLTFYLKPAWLIVLVLMAVLSIPRKSYLILACALMTLLPALILNNRQELYYLYLPLAYLCLFMAMSLINFDVQMWPLYLLVFFLLGGRKLLPPIAHQIFTNWEKHSLEQVTEEMVRVIGNDPSVKEIIITVKQERDTRMMLESGAVELFLPKEIAEGRSFVYRPETTSVLIFQK